jgi:hypothetical protein
MRGPGKGLVGLAPEAVGEQVVQAIRDNRFLLLTHPELQDVLIRRANDPEGFLAGQIATIQEEG